MATISIDYSSAKKEIYLCGDVAAIKRNRFAWRYVRDYLSPREEDNRIVIPVIEEEPIVVLSSIRSMLSKYGFSEKKQKVPNRYYLISTRKNESLMSFPKKLFTFEIMSVTKTNLKNSPTLLLVIFPQDLCILCSYFLHIIWLFLKMHAISPSLVQEKPV